MGIVMHKLLLSALLLLIATSSTFAQDDSLLELSLEELMNVQVTTASKSAEDINAAPAVMTVISANDIERSTASNLAEIIEQQAGFYLNSTTVMNQSSLVTRGDYGGAIANTHVLFLIDGRPFRESILGNMGNQFIQGMPLGRVERIEIIRGPGSVLYGSGAYTGVINVILKKGEKQETSAHLEYGSHNSMHGSIAGGGKWGDLDISAGALYTGYDDWEYEMTDVKNVHDAVPFKYMQTVGNIDLAYKGLTLKAYGGYYEQQVVTLASAPVWQTPREQMNQSNRVLVDLGYLTEVNDFWELQANVTMNSLDNVRTVDADSAKDDLFTGGSLDYIGELTNFFKLTKDINLIVGGLFNHQTGDAFQHNAYLKDYGGGIIAPAPWDIFSGENPNPLKVVPDYSYTWYSGYFQADWKVIPELKFVAGAQINKVEGVDAKIVPRIGVVYTAENGFIAKALYGQAFRSPYALESKIKIVNIQYGNDNLKPETIGTFDAQLGYKGKNFQLMANYFNSSQKDMIGFTAPGESVEGIFYDGEQIPAGSRVYINRGSVKSSGFEFEAKYYPMSELHFTANLSTFNQELTYRLPASTKDTTVENYFGLPKLLINVGITYSSKENGFSASIFNNYVGGFDEIGYLYKYNPEIEAYSMLSVYADYNIAKLFDGKSPIKVFVKVFNLLDAEIMSQDFTDRQVNTMPNRFGRSIHGGVKIVL